MPSRWLEFWRFQCVGWAIYLAATFPLKLLVFGHPSTALWVTLLRDGTAFLLTLGLRKIYRRWNQRRMPTPWLGGAVLGISILAETLESGVALGFQKMLPLLPSHYTTPISLVGVFSFRTMLFAFWSLLYFWIKDWKNAQERELHLARAESRRREAELRMLRAQVNPHFLFNALNTIQSGLSREQQALKTVVLGLADYLRYSLAHRDSDTVSLGEEFDTMLQYLKVEQGRFRDELVVEAEIDGKVRPLPVPGVILQPLVENAVHYGMEDKIRPLRIRLRASGTETGGVLIEVTNSGSWIEPKGRRPDGTGGFGLENLRRRLELLYPGRFHLKINPEPDQVTVSILLRLEHQPAPAP